MEITGLPGTIGTIFVNSLEFLRFDFDLLTLKINVCYRYDTYSSLKS